MKTKKKSEKDKKIPTKTRSKIFGDKQLNLIEKRIKGDKKDRSGAWAGKIKPKIKEIVDIWLPRKKELMKLVEEKK